MDTRYDFTAAEDAAQVARYLDLVAEMVGEFAGRGDLETATHLALTRISDVMSAEAASMFLIDGDELECRASVGRAQITGLRMPADAGVVGRTVSSCSAQLVADVRADPDFYARVSEQSGLETRSLVTAPLIVQDQCLGAVELVNKRDREAAFDERDARILQALATAAALALSNARLAEKMADQAGLQREVELAATVQRNLLPRDELAAQPGRSCIAGVNRPARGVSGDFYDFMTIGDGDVLFTVGDVSGKGMNAALVMTKAVTLFRALGKLQSDPARLMSLLQNELSATMTMGMFVTMVIGRYSPVSGRMRFANAGHPPPLLICADSVSQFPANVPPLGIPTSEVGESWGETSLAMRGGEAFYVYTDGLTECTDADGRMLDVTGAVELIRRHHEKPADEQVAAVADEALAGSSGRRDDLTLLCLRHPERIELPSHHLVARPASLKALRNVLRAVCYRAGCTQPAADGIVLAVDEAAQNIIRHVYRGEEGDIDVNMRVETTAGNADLVIELVDYGPPTAPEDCRGRELDDVRPGGLGTHFMSELMDSVRFEEPPAGAGNRIVLRRAVRS